VQLGGLRVVGGDGGGDRAVDQGDLRRGGGGVGLEEERGAADELGGELALEVGGGQGWRVRSRRVLEPTVDPNVHRVLSDWIDRKGSPGVTAAWAIGAAAVAVRKSFAKSFRAESNGSDLGA
jgi:hypothetical protein